MKTFKIILALGLTILIAAGLLFPLPQPALAQEETPQPESTHKTGNSVRGQTLPEHEIPEEDWEDYIIEETP